LEGVGRPRSVGPAWSLVAVALEYLTSKLVRFLVGCRKKNDVNLEAHCAGELNLQLCGELCRIIDEPMFLPSPEENLH